MKKLLVTAIGAAAAFGAVAGTISTQRFETAEISADSISISALNTLAGATTPAGYWSGDEETNTYKVVAVSPAPTSYPFEAAPTKGLEVKTVFGNPLTLNAVDGGTATTIPATGLYFDSEVKFTVCEDEPDQTYSGAKIVMWLQEELDGETIVGTNLIVRAGYLSKPDSTIISTPTNYVCALPAGFDVEKWHRVTIKAMANITTGGTPVPGFAIYIDPSSSATAPIWGVGCLTAPKWDATFSSAVELTEAAMLLERNYGCVFPTMDLTSGAVTTLTSAGFDGTGSITDLRFTDEAPAYAADMQEEKAYVKIGAGNDEPYYTLASAMAAVNGVSSGTVTLTLSKGLEMDAPIQFQASGATVVLDFNGCIWTNTAASFAVTNNNSNLTIRDSVGGGGVYSPAGGAIYTYAACAIESGYFWGSVSKSMMVPAQNVRISGGAFSQGSALNAYLVAGKKFAAEAVDGLYPVVNIEYKTITFNANGGEGSMAAMTVEGGVETNLTANAFTKTGYTFAGWATEALGNVVYANGASITPAANLELYAKWNAESYNVTFVDSEAVESVVITKSYGSTISAGEIPAVTGKVGYTAAWDNNPTNATVTANATYTVKYTPIQYNITFDSNGGSAVADVTFAVTNTAFDLPIPTLADNTFAGWTNETYTTAFTNFNPAAWTGYADFTLYAKWVANQTAPVIDPAAGGSGTDCGSAANAAAARDAINGNKATYITKPSTVGEGDAATTYYSYVEAKVVDTTKVAIELSEAGETAALTSANADVVTLPVAAAAAASTTAEINSIAGLYYSIVSGATPTTVTTEGDRTLGNGEKISLTLPKVGTAGFYKVKVSATDK